MQEGLVAYATALFKAARQRASLAPRRLGSGQYRTPGGGRSKYTGEQLRAIRAVRGVGRPPR
jgi:hypothetical protein